MHKQANPQIRRQRASTRLARRGIGSALPASLLAIAGCASRGGHSTDEGVVPPIVDVPGHSIGDDGGVGSRDGDTGSNNDDPLARLTGLASGLLVRR